jgi:hypothetical protein
MMNTRSFLIILALGACTNQLPPEPQGGRISGTVTYTGQANQAFARPGLVVSAFFIYPPSGSPHAFATLDMPAGTTMMAYELRNLPVGNFRILASAVDLTAPTATGPTDNPTGGYPSMCALTTPAADVPVTADVPVSDINITLFDHGGNADPCYRDTTACPPVGRAALLIELASAAPLVAPDKIGYALFPGPASAPVDFLSLAATDVPSFPHTMVRPNLAPGSYLVFVCRDVGGNNPTGCGAEDVSLYYMDKALLPLAADTITRVYFDLDAATTSLISTTTAAVEGCP